MACPPTVAKLVVNVAVPPAPTATVPRTTSPSLNVTVPVGVPTPGATAATPTLKVTAWPVTAGLTDDARATAVAAGVAGPGTAAGGLPGEGGAPHRGLRSGLPPASDAGRGGWRLGTHLGT